jgi:HlyD family secretion protein
MLIYAQRDSDEPKIQEGTEVRERERIASIPSATGMTASAKLHESVLEQVSLGLPCSITIDALPGRQFSGKVTFVALLPDQGSRWSNPNARWYRTDVAIQSPTDEIRPGMSCAITVRMAELTDALYVPVQCVFHESAGNVSYVSSSRGIEVRPVTVGRYNVENVQILSGLSEGETVLLSRPKSVGASEPEEAQPEQPEFVETAAQAQPASN